MPDEMLDELEVCLLSDIVPIYQGLLGGHTGASALLTSLGHIARSLPDVAGPQAFGPRELACAGSAQAVALSATTSLRWDWRVAPVRPSLTSSATA